MSTQLILFTQTPSFLVLWRIFQTKIHQTCQLFAKVAPNKPSFKFELLHEILKYGLLLTRLQMLQD